MSDKKTNIVSSLIPAIAGGAVFFLFLLGGANFFVALGLGIAGFVGGTLLFASKGRDLDLIVDGITKEKYREIIEQGQTKLKTLGSFIGKVESVEVKKKVKEITDIVEKIFLDLKKDPKDVKVAREFLSYYLDTTLNILNRYVDISRQKLKSKKITEMLDTIKRAFEKQLEKLLRDDILDLDSDIAVLEQTMKTELME
jgi:5-bromo-4-chloroindolyl phosphate hydrolysis protein